MKIAKIIIFLSMLDGLAFCSSQKEQVSDANKKKQAAQAPANMDELRKAYNELFSGVARKRMVAARVEARTNARHSLEAVGMANGNPDDPFDSILWQAYCRRGLPIDIDTDIDPYEKILNVSSN